MTQKDERITGKFFEIEPNVNYYVRIHLLLSKDSTYYTSNLREYLYPVDIAKQSIEIKGSDINFLYLKNGTVYTLDFKENEISKRLIKLSRKTLDAEILINDELKLNNESFYYQLTDNFKGELKLEVKENDAFIEFLSSEEDYDILTNESLTDYKLIKETNVIIINETQKDFYLKLSSDKIFSFSFSYGFSNMQNFFYNNIKPCLNASKQTDTYAITFELFVPFKNINLTENEFLSFTIKIEKEAEQNVFIDYEQTSPISSLLDEKLDKSYCENIIKNLIEMFDLYIFTDIAKNPPNIEGIPNYHHRKIDVQKELSEVKTEGRFFYEFYQEIMTIIDTLKDIHLSLYAKYTPKGIPIIQYQIAMPFNLYIKPDENNEFKLYIQLNNIIKYYSEDFKNLLTSCENIPIKAINDLDPFDFVQNFSNYRNTKNVHAQFTYTMNSYISLFSLYSSPLKYSDFAFFDYEFENNIMIRIFPHRFPDIVDAEFNNFYEEYINQKEKEIGKENEIKSGYFSLPSFEEIKAKYFEYKGFNKKGKILKENLEKIDWNITINDPDKENKYIKCRVDDKNKVNVILQNSFRFEYLQRLPKMIQCAEMLHTNNYPIIIIESFNGGGSAFSYMTMHQLLQMRTVDRAYFSYKTNEITKKLFSKDNEMGRTNFKTCKEINSFNDFKEVKDSYNYNGENIEHIRSEAMDMLPFYLRNIFRDYRAKYKNSQNLKRPTDIIIFTDSFSYSGTCGFIKGFQNTGGAIIVGYYGNPKIKGKDLFDGSQSISSVSAITDLDIYKNLEKLNFHISQVTVAESFDDSVYGPNPIPREYALDPVDERVDIYSNYNDDLYEEFIKQGKEIHDKYNNKNYCNSKNEKLLLHDDNCSVNGKEHAHGGYRCKSDESEWNKTECQAYYCDIGFYYNQYEQKCMEECNFNNSKSYLIFDDIKDKKYEIEKNLLTTFTFISENSQDNFFYNSSESLITKYPKIGFIHTDTIFLNNEKQAENNYEFRISKIKTDLTLLTQETKSFNENYIGFISNNKTIIVFQFPEDHIFYASNIFYKKENKIKYTQFNNQMKLDDILEGNNEYFKEYTNDDDFIYFQKDEAYILIMNYSSFTQTHYFLGPKKINENINIIGNDTNFLFLEKDKTYELDFKDNAIDRLIKLSRKTLNSEINIIDENIVLNSNNIYYQLKDGFKGKIKLEVKKSDALIEFLFKFNDCDLLFYGNNARINSTHRFIYITAISEREFSKAITFNLQSDKKLSFKFFVGYSMAPYSYYFPGDANDLSRYYNTNIGSITISPQKIKLVDNEYFFAVFENLGNYLSISISEEDIIPDSTDKEEEESDETDDNPDNKKEESKGEDGLESWKIALIVVGSILAVILLAVIIFYFLRKNKRLTNKSIEQKMENLTDIRD